MHKYIATILILGSMAFAADAPKLSEVNTLKVQKSYLAAVIAQQNLQTSQKAFDTAKATFLKTIEDAKKQDGLPADADVRVDQESNVTVTLPEAPKAKENINPPAAFKK